MVNPAKFKAVGDGIYKEVTTSRRGHSLFEMLEQEVEPVFRDQLTAAHSSLDSNLKAVEGLFQASRYPFEEKNKVLVVEGKDKIAFEVAQFLSCAVSELKPMLVHKN